MTKKFSKKWLIALVSIIVVTGSYKIVRACAGGDWFVGDSSNITPEAFVQDSTYYPFFYSDMFYYNINYDDAHNTRFNQTNVEEWDNYLSHSVDTTTLKYLMYQVDLKGIDKLYSKKLTPSVQLPDSLQKRYLKLHMDKPQVNNFLQYLKIAKEAEEFCVSEYRYSWDPPKKVPEYSNFKNFNLKVQAGFGGAKEPFIKERYWFQLVRFNYFYNPAAAISTFENNKATFATDNMFYRTMAYAAGAYYKEKRYARANYYYSLVFSDNKQLRTVAHYSFHPQEEADWQQTLSLCKSAEEKATLWQMLGIFYKDELRSMKEIYKIAPQSPKLDLLLTRYVNIYEVGGIYSSEKEKDSIRNSKKRELAWINETAKAGKTSNQFLWNVSAGYLSFMQDNYAEASGFYTNARKSLKSDDKLASGQLRLLELLNNIGKLNRITEKDENALLSDLNWLFYDEKPTNLRTSNAESWVRKTMSKKYAQQGEMQKSECYQTSAAFYTKDDNITQYRNFLEKKKYSPYELFCKKITSIKLNDVYDFLAVRETLENKDLNKAYNLFVQSGDSTTLMGNPFNGRIADCHDCDHAAPQKVKYTKGELVKKLILLKSNIESGQDVYNNALLLGNAFYNMSYYGNARLFYEGSIYGMEEPSEASGIDYNYKNILTDNSIAYSYYQKALLAAENDEQKAKCYYMMAKCERNKWYNQTFYSNQDSYYDRYKNKLPDFVEWESFRKLKEYSQTAYYKDVIKECGYFRKVARKK